MKRVVFFLLFFFLLAFACNTDSVNEAYKEYYKYQQDYVSAILDDNKKEKIEALKGLISCGEFLKFNVEDYKKKLKSLTASHSSAIHKKTVSKSTYSRYVKIYSFSPLKVRIPKNVKYFTINKKVYKKVFDIKEGIVTKPIFGKKLNGDIYFKIAQFNKSTARIVLYSTKPFSIKYSLKNHLLIISYYALNGRKKKTNVLKKTYAKKTAKTPIHKKTPQNIKKPPMVVKRSEKIIVIDPGHGGRDSGGVGVGNRYEKVAVLKIAKYLEYYLKKLGYKVYLTRNSDYFIPLKKRTHFANIKKADLFISIHCNIAPKHNRKIRGIETYFLSPTRNERAIRVARLENKEVKGLNYLDQRVILNFLNRDRMIDSNKLAIDIQKGMLYNLRKHYKYVVDNGVRPAPFWVLVGTQMPAILIETGYLTNPMEASRLFSANYEKRLAKGIAIGIENYFRKNK